MQHTYPPTLKELEESRLALIKSMQKAEKLDAKPKDVQLIKIGLKHIDEMIEALHADADD